MKNKDKTGKLDIVVGGQFGDEGKGALVAWLTNRRRYDFAVRVGGYSAEHRFVYKGKVVTGRVLPCSLMNPKTDLYLGAGHLFSLEALKNEAENMSRLLEREPGEEAFDRHRIYIDKNAGIVTDKHMSQSKKADRSKRGGTTGQGAGKAATDKVLRDGTFTIARQYPELKEIYGGVIDIARKIREGLNTGVDGLLEGSQGALISVNHGYYPFCCAKDVTPAGVLAEVGAGISDIRDIYAIYRFYPMRVPGDSGPTGGREITWSELEEKIGVLSNDVKKQTLPDGTKGQYERIFAWDWDDFAKSIILCSPTKIVLTFADWHHPNNKGVKDWMTLDGRTKRFIYMVEMEASEILKRRVPVVMIRTGPEENDYITRK